MAELAYSLHLGSNNVNDTIRMYKKRNLEMYKIVHKKSSKSTFFFDILTSMKWR